MKKYQSSVYPLIEFPEVTQKYIGEYINPQLELFFKSQNKTSWHQIDTSLILTNNEMKQIEISYFYSVIFEHINKTNISEKALYSIIFDKNQEFTMCPHTKLSYSHVSFHDKPVYFLIYINIQNVFDFIYKKMNN